MVWQGQISISQSGKELEEYTWTRNMMKVERSKTSLYIYIYEEEKHELWFLPSSEAHRAVVARTGTKTGVHQSTSYARQTFHTPTLSPSSRSPSQQINSSCRSRSSLPRIWSHVTSRYCQSIFRTRWHLLHVVTRNAKSIPISWSNRVR